MAAACYVVGGSTTLAGLLGVTPQAMSQWLSGVRPLPAERCLLIERATKGAIKCEQLRPDVAWAVLRPEVMP